MANKSNKSTARTSRKPAKRVAPEATEQAAPVEASAPRSEARTTGPGWAVWILSRFPGVRNNYQEWGRGKRIFIAILLYLISLPIIPIVAMIVLYARDPEGFKKSPMLPILATLTAAWFGGFGWIANQTPITDGTPYASVKEKADGETTTANSDPAAQASQASKEKVAKQTTSRDSGGRKFENCTAAFEAGVFDIKRTNPSYERRLDRDNDGIACEK